MASTFTARFRGRCYADCGEPIEPGDDVAYVNEHLMHVDCSGLAPREDERPVTICPDCHPTRPCDCGVS